MLVLVDLLELEAVVAPELGVASSHGVGGFQQIVAQVTVAGFDQASILGLEFIGLVLRLDESRIIWQRIPVRQNGRYRRFQR